MRDPHTFYITTPIYYVNGRPHIGHAYTTVAADAISRWRRLLGHDVFFLTGTDEHGQKVMEAAAARGMTPKAHCDDLVVEWKSMMAKLGITYDRFFRTTDDDHVANVRGVLQHLWERGLIYKDEYEGWYHVSDEIFVTDKDLEEGRYKPEELQRITEANYFFRMSAFHERLIATIESDPGLIRPEARRNEVLGFLRKPLHDLCISRPKSRMSWGIELPFDGDYVTYVWFDALLNYLTGVGYTVHGDAGWQKWWPADFQLLGKDILTTHAVYWSTMLFAMNVPLAQCLYAHGWWKSAEGEKISKSKGNMIDVDLLVDGFGVDATRYFLLREVAFGADGAFSWEIFLNRYNSDLANDYGNLVHRGLSMVEKWLHGAIPPIGIRTPREEQLAADVGDAVARFAAEIDALQFHRAIEAVLDVVRAGHKYIDDTAPWSLNKQGDTARLGTVLRHVVELGWIATCLLAPIMPERTADLAARLGRGAGDVKGTVQRLASGEVTLAELDEGASFVLGEPLFPRQRELPESVASALAEAAPSAPPPAPKKERPPLPAEIAYDDFARIGLRAGRVLAAEPHPNADKLLVLTVDIGEAAPRTICAGIRSRYPDPSVLVGQGVVVVANLAPRKLRGVTSHGMLLAAGDAEVVGLVSVDAEPGEVVR